MNKHWFALILFVCCQGLAFGADKDPLSAVAAAGVPLKTSSVQESITLKAVLLPPRAVRKVFGSEVSDNYAVVHLTIGNSSKDSAFILHHIFLDYSRWGILSKLPGPTPPPTPTNPNQAFTAPKQMGSVESRIVRSELLDAQPWTLRNFSLRLLKSVGGVASGFGFIWGEDAVRGMAAFSGVVVPTLETLFPDPIIGQLNRISDYGFRTPMVLPREDGNIVVAFFPLDRILTPSLKKAFLKSPAVFFNPELITMDKGAQNALSDVLDSFFPGGILGMRAQIQQLSQSNIKSLQDSQQSPANTGNQFQQIIDTLRTLSIDNVLIGVEGILVTDNRTLVPSVESASFEKDSMEYWQATGKKKLTLTGRYFEPIEKSEVRIADSDSLGLKCATPTQLTNDKKALTFECENTKPIPTGTVIRLRYVKHPDNLPEVVGNEFLLSITYDLKSPSISSISWAPPLLTINGSRFLGAAGSMTVELTGKDAINFTTFKESSDTKIVVDLSSLSAACYSLRVFNGPLMSLEPQNLAVLPSSITLKSASIVEDRIQIEWSTLPDFGKCPVSRTFSATKEGQSAVPLTGEVKVEGKPTQLRLVKPGSVGAGWNVEMKLEDKFKNTARGTVAIQ